LKDVFGTIADLKRENITMLLVEQFAVAALDVADFGYVLENGCLTGAGEALVLKSDPAVRAAYLGKA
jgi:branched-chain amino acid transport system ATP-binding protein